MFTVIAYDITCDNRRNRLVKILLGYGGERVNYSVFEFELRISQYRKLKEEIKQTIDTDEDRVRYYELCADCVTRISINGKRSPYEKDLLLFV